MALDTYSYTAPSRVKTLVVPIEGMSIDKFEKYYNSSLSKYFEVRLVDVSPSKGLFNPQGYPYGRIIYDYQLVPPDTESMFLQDFEPFRKVFNVLGIATHSENLDVEQKLSQLKKEHISAINHNIIVCDVPQNVIDSLPSHKNIFYLSKSQNITALETVLCDMTSNFLESLSTYASSYQHVTLRSPGSVGPSEVSSSGSRLKRSLSSSAHNGNLSASLKTTKNPSSSSSSSSSSSFVTEKRKKRISSASFLPNFENSAANLNQDRLRSNRIKGRQQKIFGNFYLLSGRLSDSLKEFCDAIVLLKQVNDYLWLGSALDGLGVCIMMLSFLEVPFQLPSAVLSIIKGGTLISNLTKDAMALSPSTSPRNSLSRTVSNQLQIHSTISTNNNQTQQSLSLISEFNLSSVAEQIFELIRKAIQFYKMTFDLVEDYVPQIVYCETLLRFVKLSSLIHINSGLDFNLLKHIIKGASLTHKKHELHIGDPGATYIIDKIQIREIESEIFTSQFPKLDFIHKARIYSCLISVATDLNLLRRRSFLMKELFDIISPSLHDKPAEINTSLSSMSQKGKIHVDYKRNLSSIVHLTDEILKSYGVAVEYSVGQFVDPNWIDIHLIMLKKFVDLTEKLGYFDASMKYGSILLRRYSFVLSHEEQITILNRIKRQVKQMHLSDVKPTLHYWDDYMARSISFLPSVNDLTALKQTKSIVDGDSSRFKTEVYNPFSSIKDIEDELVTLVQNESTDIIITLQNPFAFDIDVKNLEIVCENSFKTKIIQVFPSMQQQPPQSQEAQTDSIIVKAGQLMDVAVAFIPLQFGKLNITGIKAEVCGCVTKVFNIAVSKDFKVYQKIKKVGVNNFLDNTEPSILYQNEYTDSVTKSLKFHVLPPQPVLSLIDTSLLNSSIMLLEGEMKIFTIKLQNNSEVEINNLTSLFFDSTTEPLKKALNSKLPPNEIYEIEYYLLKKLPFNIINKNDLTKISSHQVFSIDISLLGKRGMTHGSIMMEYSNIIDEILMQYARRIDVPINVTVYPSIEISSCDIVPIFSSNEIFANNIDLLTRDKRGSFWSYLNKRVALGDNLAEYCLLLLDVRNSWTGDLNVNLESSVDALLDDEMVPISNISPSELCSITDVVGKGRTMRFLIPIKRIRLQEKILAKPIPSLRNKQFILDSNTPKEEQKFVREAFWYRQELLKHVQGNWKTTEDDSHGDIELRGMRLSSKMINILKVDTVEIEQKIYHNGKGLDKSDSLSYSLDLQTFYTIRTKITNRSGHPLKGMIRHVPMSKSTNVSIDRKILYNGVLQFFLPKKLYPNESMDLEMPICILESGEYEWGSLFDELESDGSGNPVEKESHTQRGSLFIIAN